MIELMLEAERAMGVGLFDNAERLYAQVAAADPHNSIAVTGLARVALERGDQRGAYLLARRALAIDPDNPVAGHLARRMAEQLQIRGEALPAHGSETGPRATAPAPAPETAPPVTSSTPTTPAAAATQTAPPALADGPSQVLDAEPAEPAEPAPEPPRAPGILGRLLRRRR